MNGNKILSSLSYFSIFFAPFLFPILVFILAGKEVKSNAAKALWMHLVAMFSVFIGFGLGSYLVRAHDLNEVGLIVMVVFSIISVVYFIWNIVKGITVLLQD